MMISMTGPASGGGQQHVTLAGSVERNTMSTPRQIIVESSETVSRGFLNITRYALRHSTPDGGMSGTIIREVMERGHAAAVLVYDPGRDEVLLVEEFRVGNLAAGLPPEECWSLGPVAGMIDEGETGMETAIREAREEAGIDLNGARVAGPLRYLSSPGGSSEMIEIFVACADLGAADAGLVSNDEGEFTRPVTMSRDELDSLVMTGLVPASLVAASRLLDKEFPRGSFALITTVDGEIYVDAGHPTRESALNALRAILSEIARRHGHAQAVSADLPEGALEDLVDELDLDGITWRIEEFAR